ncbi:MAG: hypothetical protein P8Y52_11725 [Xanthomonadales bacterium]
MLGVHRLVTRIQCAAEEARELAQVGLGVAGRDAVAGAQHDVGQRIDECPLAALYGFDLQAVAGAQNGGRQAPADHRAVRVQPDLRRVQAGDRPAHRRLADRGDARRHLPQIQRGEETGDGCRPDEIEHVEGVHAHVFGHVDHQQVGRRADRGRHAAEDARKPHRNQRAGGRFARAQGHADQDGQHQYDDGRVVDERAQNGGDQDRDQQRDARPAAPETGQEAADRLQCPGADQPLADDHQPGDRDQRLVTETEEEVGRLQHAAVGLVGKQRETDRERDEHDEAGRLQRDTLPREQDQGHDDQDHHGQRVRVR